MISDRRNSGATLQYPTVLKLHSDSSSYLQATLMRNRPDVFCPVLASGATDQGQYFYVTPLFCSYSTGIPLVALQSAILKLRSLWGTHTRRVDQSRVAYQEYVSRLDVPGWLARSTLALYELTKNVPGHSAVAVHGDATLQNIVYDGSEAWWIDPNPRPVPMERELDLGKLRQSILGYDDCAAETVEALEPLFCHATKELQNYYLLTHLCRLWRYQPASHAWVYAVVTSLNATLAFTTA